MIQPWTTPGKDRRDPGPAGGGPKRRLRGPRARPGVVLWRYDEDFRHRSCPISRGFLIGVGTCSSMWPASLTHAKRRNCRKRRAPLFMWPTPTMVTSFTEFSRGGPRRLARVGDGRPTRQNYLAVRRTGRSSTNAGLRLYHTAGFPRSRGDAANKSGFRHRRTFASLALGAGPARRRSGRTAGPARSQERSCQRLSALGPDHMTGWIAPPVSKLTASSVQESAADEQANEKVATP